MLSPGIDSPGITLDAGRRHHLRVNELVTTLTEENAIAAPDIIGCMYSPIGRNIPIASGIPITLYMQAQIKFRLITANMLRES